MNDDIPFFVPYNGEIPKEAKIFGKYRGVDYYIGRSRHQGSLTPGIVLNEGNGLICLIPWGTVSNRKHEFEILVGGNTNNWTVAEDGHAPLNAFKAGHSESGETLYIGRCNHEGHVVVGKVQPSHHVCYIPFREAEVNSRNYEIFVI